ncbi:MAG: ABC transporter ATP-binding protein [Crenarchaeota archaeon]|nr:ABC transporter ATP-binding protein [Thermoproteota archaeon]
MPEPIISVRNLVVFYRGLRGYVHAVDNVSLDIMRNEVLGVVGESGSGKSTLALSILRILPKSARIVKGSIMFDNIDLAKAPESTLRKVRWRRISYVPQAALNALNPTLKIVDHIVETAKAHGVRDRRAVIEKAKELFEMLRLDPKRVLNSYPHELSGGMRQRVTIALGLILDPEVVILDEPTTALDVLTQRFILDLLKDLRRKINITMVFITHDIAIEADLADRVAVMYAGKLMELGDVYQIFKDPKHPYTQALIRSIPSLIGSVDEMKPIPGSPPDLVNPPPGCRFHPRCPLATDICRRKEPPLIELENGRIVSCWLYAPEEAKKVERQ